MKMLPRFVVDAIDGLLGCHCTCEVNALKLDEGWSETYMHIGQQLAPTIKGASQETFSSEIPYVYLMSGVIRGACRSVNKE